MAIILEFFRIILYNIYSIINSLHKQVKAIIIDQLDVDDEKVTLTSHIQDDLGADSLDVVDLVMSFEDEFDMEIPDDQVENIKTVEDVVKYIEGKVE
jgi:acyl carrier protein